MFSPSLSKFSPRILGIMLITLVVSACAPAAPPTPVYQRVTDAKLKAGQAIPAPTGDVIVTVTGKIGTKNTADSIQMDLPTIESVGLVDLKVKDPFDNVPRVFRGVVMSDLLDLWKVDAAATTLGITALNDYKVDVPISDLRKYPVIFALQQDGQYMPVSTRGPAMLVYPYDNFQFDPKKYNDYWIWQIKSIEVK
jgi:hypothetical protein